jgi:hypothetical protein
MRFVQQRLIHVVRESLNPRSRVVQVVRLRWLAHGWKYWCLQGYAAKTRTGGRGRKVNTACSTTAGVRPGDVSGWRDRSKSPSPPAASFLLRFGWSSGPAIALYLAKGVVPHLRLEQTSYRFSDSTLFERVALHDATIDGAADGPRRLRETLVGQTAPVIEALHDWSRMTRPGLWGQVTSSWGT